MKNITLYTKNITFTFFIYIILLSGLLTLLDYTLHNYSNFIPAFGFITGSLYIILLFQYVYIRKINKKFTIPFLKHSVIGYFIAFFLAFLFYITIIYNIIPETYTIYSFVFLNVLICFIYLYLFRDLFF